MDMPPRVIWRKNGVEDKIITTGSELFGMFPTAHVHNWNQGIAR